MSDRYSDQGADDVRQVAEQIVAPTDPRTVASMAERVAVLETKTNALKEDTSAIRFNLHGISNKMQEFVAAEMRCADNLAKIVEAIRDLPMIAAAMASFNEMRPELRDVFNERQRQEGLSAFGKRFAMIVAAAAGLVAAVGGIAGGLVWLSQHLRP